jgi:phospholipase C
MWHHVERHELRRLSRRSGNADSGPRPRPDLAPGTDLLPQIEHIVILMMENHSYDNYLGMLPGRGEGFPLGPDGEPDVVNKGPDGSPVRPRHQPATRQRVGVPSQSWHASHVQWAEGRLDGFAAAAQLAMEEAAASGKPDPGPAASAPAAAMGYWSERDLPFYYGLARTFPVADHWFSSCLGPTFPNRRFLIAGTAHGLIDDAPYDLLDYPPAGTILDMLARHQIGWVNYHPGAGGQGRSRHYARHGKKMARRRLMSAARSVPGVAQGMGKDIQFTADVFPLGIGRYMQHIRGIDQFFTDARDGTLPAFSIVDPDFDDYSEENPQDIRRGESFASEVISQVMAGKGWPRTLLIWVYDENGGYYDHVPPPPAVPPDDVTGRSLVGSRTARVNKILRPVLRKQVAGAEQLDSGWDRYDRYGFRVPAVIVSPYARPDYVCSEVLDHTSVLRLVEEKWNLPPLTARDAAARTPLDALDLSGPPTFLDPPALPEPSLRWGTW